MLESWAIDDRRACACAWCSAACVLWLAARWADGVDPSVLVQVQERSDAGSSFRLFARLIEEIFSEGWSQQQARANSESNDVDNV